MTTMTTFKFTDLEGAARERAIEWYKESSGTDWEPETDDICEALRYLGFTLDTNTVKLMSGKTRQEPDIGYNIGYCQGDYANFSGAWRADEMELHKLQEDRPTDTTLLTLGAQLMASVLRWPQAVAHVTGRMNSAQLDWAYTDADDPRAEAHTPDDEQLEVDLEKIIEGLYTWVYDQLRDELSYHTSEELAVEMLTSGDYEFDEDGNVQ